MQPIEIAILSDRHFWREGYDKAKPVYEVLTYRDCAGDVHMALDAVGTDGLDTAIEAATALVAVRWPTIVRVADALAERGQLDRADVRELLRPQPRPTWASPIFCERVSA
jgi:hypothetical protein